MNVMDLRNLEKQRLVAQIRSLRRLPPHTRLPELYQSDQALFNLLLHLPAKTDPLLWLEEERGDLTARVLLWIALNRLRAYLHGVERAIQAGQTVITARDQARLRALLELPQVRKQLQQLAGTHPTAVDLESLAAACQAIRNAYQGNAIRSFQENDCPNESYFQRGISDQIGQLKSWNFLKAHKRC